MRLVRIFKLMVCSVLCFVFSDLHSQGIEKILDNSHIRLGLGSSLYYGDVRVYRWYPVSKDHSEYGWSASVSGDKYLLPWFGVRGEILYGSIAGTKREFGEGAPALIAIDGVIQDYSLAGVINFAHLFGYHQESKVSLYGFGGVGYFRYQTTVNDLRYFTQPENSSQYEDLQKKKDGKETSLLAGLGLGYKFYPRLSLSLEGSFRPVISDKIDGVTGGSEYDMLQYISFGLTYDLFKKKVKKVIEKKSEVVVPQPKLVDERTKPVKQDIEPIVKPIEEKLEYVEPSVWKPDTVYRVQIAASKEPIHYEYFLSKYSMEEKVYENVVNTWNCYSIGAFMTSEDAFISLEKVVNEYQIKDAFVIGYANGQRFIPSRERSHSDNTVMINPLPDEISFGVQVVALKQRKLSKEEIKKIFNTNEQIIIDTEGSWVRYILGSYNSVEKARQIQKQIQEKGFEDAFIVRIKDGRRYYPE